MTKASPATLPEQNVTIKTTTFKEVLPAAKKEYPEFFEFVRTIPPEKTNDYVIYLYRTEPSKVPIDHTPGKTFDIPGFGLVPVLDQEAIEAAVAKVCGGGTYRLICNLRSSGEWQCQSVFRIDLAPKPSIVPWYIQRGENKPDANGKPAAYSSSSDGQIANRLVDVVATQEHKAVDLALTTMERAGNMIRNYSPQPPVAPAPPADPFEQEFKRKMVEHIFKQMENGGNGGNGGGGISQNLSGLREVIAFARELSGSAAPAASVGAEMVRVVAGAIPQAIEGIREWRLGQEAARDTAAMMHAAPQPRPAIPAPVMLPPSTLPNHNFPSVNPTKIPPPAMATHPAPQSAPPPAQPDNGAPTIEFVERCIVDILKAPMSAEDAADEAIGFLENLAGPNPPPERDYVNQLCALGETGLVQLFQMKPNLQPACANTGRLLEFLRAFLRIHAQDVAQDEQARKPN